VNVPRLNFTVCLLLCGASISSAPPCARASSDDEITAVSSRTSGDYARVRLADGSLQAETYAFAEGGRWTAASSDASVDKLQFMDVARTIAVPLEYQHYVPTRDPKTTKLLIMVYWGRTGMPERSNESVVKENLQDASGTQADAKRSNEERLVASEGRLNPGSGMVCGHFATNSAVTQVADQIDADNAMTGAMALVAAENRSRDQVNAQSAAMLGYGALWNSSAAYQGTPLEYRRQDLINELEEGRYFVVLMAFDFQKMWKEKKHKLLWETRVSVRQRRHDFDRELLAMAKYASQYFGQDSHGLVRRALPEGRVDIGELKTIASEQVK